MMNEIKYGLLWSSVKFESEIFGCLELEINIKSKNNFFLQKYRQTSVRNI